VPLLSKDIDADLEREQRISGDLRECLNSVWRHGLGVKLSRATSGEVSSTQASLFAKKGQGSRRVIALIEKAAEDLGLWPPENYETKFKNNG
jgi:hypothetical protein